MKIPAILRGLWRKVSPVEPTSTDRVFKSIWPGRQWRIDDAGIHEFRQDQPYTTVFWADLAGFDGQKLRAVNGAGSRVLLPTDRLAKFRAALYAEWERRFPERVRANRALALRKLAWFVFFWLPLLYAAVCVPMYLTLPIAAHRGAATVRQLHTKINVTVVMSVVSLLLLWVSYGYRLWKFRRS